VIFPVLPLIRIICDFVVMNIYYGTCSQDTLQRSRSAQKILVDFLHYNWKAGAQKRFGDPTFQSNIARDIEPEVGTNSV
jgi:hypothetical protein